jgi:hypothetical protein
MKESFEDGAGHIRPRFIVLDSEFLPRSEGNDLDKPRIELPFGTKLSKQVHDRFCLLLQPIHLETLVVEAIDGVLVASMVARLGEQFLDVGLVDSEVDQERGLHGPFPFDGPKVRLVVESLVPLLELPASLMLERQET